MSRISISKEQARRFLIYYHGLDSSKVFVGEKGILEYIKRVGCIQYDPLNVVGQNADLVLQSRISGYSHAILEKLLYTDRSLIDGWDKMMSIYRQEDWPLFQRLRMGKEKEVKGTLKHRDSLEALNLTEKIRELLMQKGPLQATQIHMGEAGKGRWGHRNLSGAAMDYLFNTGELGINVKRGSQKVYDLIENLLPHELLNNLDPFTNERDFCKWYFKRRVGSIGLIWERSGGGWLGQFLSDKELRKSILSELVEEKSLITCFIEGIEETFYMRQKDFTILDSVPVEKEAIVRFLAPLDNLLWDRDMIEKIFNFKYSWEVYLPLAKRKYGYYVLPVLYGNQLVARFEPENQRGKDPLKIKNWWWEKDITINNQMKTDILDGFKIFAEYLGTDFQKESIGW
jgi:uncharacterized protein